MNKIILKHSFTDARDCCLEYEIDFGTMTFVMKTDFVSPALLIDLLKVSHRYDERLEKTGINTIWKLFERFQVSIDIDGVLYQMSIYKPGMPRFDGQIECELTPMHLVIERRRRSKEYFAERRAKRGSAG